LNYWLLCLFYLLVAGAALQDAVQLKISNLWPAALLLLFGVWVWANGVHTGLWQNGASFAATLALGMLLFAIRWFGGGDAKLLAAASIWFDIQGGLFLLAWTTMSGGMLGLGLIFGRRLLPEAIHARFPIPALRRRGPIPYGIAIAAGAAMTMAMHGAHPSGAPKLPDLHLSAFPSS
jgi:prepilin peptidase CpaA